MGQTGGYENMLVLVIGNKPEVLLNILRVASLEEFLGRGRDSNDVIVGLTLIGGEAGARFNWFFCVLLAGG
jgi:hypothetical protein